MNSGSIQFNRHEDVIEVQIPVTPAPLAAQQVREALTEAGFGRCFVVNDQLVNLLADYQAIQSEIKLNKLPLGYPLKRKIAQRKNAELKIEIAPDSMTAVAEITSAWGGQPISANELVKSAQEAGVTFGFVKEQIVKLVTHASRTEPGIKSQLVIAVGRVMQPGLNARFEPMVAGMTNRSTKPRVISESRVDPRDFGVIPSVQQGNSVVKRLPPTKGVDGVTVRGEISLAPPGQQIEWTLGEGVEISSSDPDLLIASRDGMPRILDAGATVDEVYAVKTVDLSTGHVQFKGSVIVNGDVTASMKVIAGGNVFVKGIVEGSLIEAGGDVTIGGSVIGHQLAEAVDNEIFSTVIKAGGDVHCTLAQYVKVDCVGDFHASKQINHCEVSARMVIAGPEDKLNGKVVGGRFYLDYGIKAGILGALSESHMLLNLNRRVDPILEQQQALRQNVSNVKEEMEQIKASIEPLKQMEKSDAINEHIAAFMQEFEAQKAIALALIEDIKLLETERQGRMAETAVLVKQQMFAGIEILLGTETLPIKRGYGPSKVNLVEGSLKVEPI